MKPAPIQIDRRWIGAPDTAWNPTLSLFVVAVGGTVALASAAVLGALPLWAAVGGLAVCLYLGFTVLHDAMHGTAHRSKPVGRALGRICGFLLLAPLPIFRGVHHAHHGHTNDPDRDPDLFVTWGPAWARPLALAAGLSTYRWFFYRHRLWRSPKDLREAVLSDALIVLTMASLAAMGFGAWVLWLWLAPVALGAFWLAFAFDYLPHHPHTHRGRYYDTRVMPGRVANAVLLGQNYHLIHHLWTTIPWYRYQSVFAEIEDELRKRDCAIGWRSRAEAPADAGVPKQALVA